MPNIGMFSLPIALANERKVPSPPRASMKSKFEKSFLDLIIFFVRKGPFS